MTNTLLDQTKYSKSNYNGASICVFAAFMVTFSFKTVCDLHAKCSAISVQTIEGKVSLIIFFKFQC